MGRRLSIQERRTLDIQTAFGNQTLEQQAITHASNAFLMVCA
jgi:hypothetical protein